MKALKITKAIIGTILAYCILLALKAVLLPYPNTPKANWSYITSNQSTQDDILNGLSLLISFALQVLFLSLGWMWLFWIVFAITHLFISLRKLITWLDIENEND